MKKQQLLVQYKGIAFMANDAIYSSTGGLTGHVVRLEIYELPFFEGLINSKDMISHAKKEGLNYIKLFFLHPMNLTPLMDHPNYYCCHAEPEDLEVSAIVTFLLWQAEDLQRRFPHKEYSISWQQHRALWYLLERANLKSLNSILVGDEYIGIQLGEMFVGIEKDGYTHS